MLTSAAATLASLFPTLSLVWRSTFWKCNIKSMVGCLKRWLGGRVFQDDPPPGCSLQSRKGVETRGQRWADPVVVVWLYSRGLWWASTPPSAGRSNGSLVLWLTICSSQQGRTWQSKKPKKTLKVDMFTQVTMIISILQLCSKWTMQFICLKNCKQSHP